MCTLQLPPKTITASCGRSTATYLAMTEWIPAISVKYLKVLLELLDSTVGFRVIAAFQLATTDTSSPGSWTDFDPSSAGFISSVGKYLRGLSDISSNTDGAFYIRFGIGVKSATDGNFERGQVTLVVTARS